MQQGCGLCNMLTAKVAVADLKGCRQPRGLGLVVSKSLGCCRSEQSAGYCRAFAPLPGRPRKLQQRKWLSARAGQPLQMATSTCAQACLSRCTGHVGFDAFFNVFTGLSILCSKNQPTQERVLILQACEETTACQERVLWRVTQTLTLWNNLTAGALCN